jgi:hypothetical protein
MIRSTIESFARDSSVWDGIDSDKLKMILATQIKC